MDKEERKRITLEQLDKFIEYAESLPPIPNERRVNTIPSDEWHNMSFDASPERYSGYKDKDSKLRTHGFTIKYKSYNKPTVKDKLTNSIYYYYYIITTWIKEQLNY